MNKRSSVKIFIFIFIALLLLLTCHFFLHGLEREEGHCSLCDLLATGYTCIEWFILLLSLFFVASIPPFITIPFIVSAFRHIQLRAPPYPLNERSLFGV